MLFFKRKYRKKPLGTDTFLSTDEIQIPRRFRLAPPKQNRYNLYEQNIVHNKQFDIPITVHKVYNEKHPLGAWYVADGYIRLLVAKNLGIKKVPCKIIVDE